MKNSSQESKTRQVPNLICLTGIDGSGKSTHLRRLSKWLEEKHNLKSSPLSVWEIAKNPTYHKHPFISDRNAVHKYLGMLHPTARALFIFHGLFESFDLTKDSIAPIVIADGYWYKYAFTENLQGQDLDWLLAICGRFPKPKLTILLDLDPVDAWQRKPNITP
ncbi:hypothetical protein HYY75_11485, partial [bacterium]|nr:hypothetical protein [bacterium]